MSANYTTSVVVDAQRLRDADWSLSDIRRQIVKAHGVSPSNETLLLWTDQAYAERRRAKQRKRRTVVRSRRWSFRLSGPSQTPEYKAAFMVRLRDERVPRTSIAKVCTVVFGEPWTREQVGRVLEELG